MIDNIDNNNLFLSKLSQNLLETLNDDEYYDIIIEVGIDPYVKIFRAHMVILYYRSPYLKRILSTNNHNKNDGTLVHIKLPNISPEIFQIILRYIYCGKISLKEYDTLDIIKILIAANELSLQELIIYLQSFLIENNSNWLEQNIDLIYKISFDENDSFLKLRNYCNDLILKYPDKIFKSLNFSLIPENLLISIIKNFNIHQNINEIQIWDYILKWGISQNPELSFSSFSSSSSSSSSTTIDPKNFSKNDFIILKNTLQKIIPFIKFNNLTCKDFLDKISPYKKILPKNLYKKLLKDFLNLLDPNVKLNNYNTSSSKFNIIITKKEIDLLKTSTSSNSTTKNNIINSSKIITYQHFELILKWIDKLEFNDNLISNYDFKLLFRASNDNEFNYENFHKICDNQSRTIVIIKVKNNNNNEILGGYNPIEWNSNNNYGITKDSFIFSFNNNNSSSSSNNVNVVLSRVINENNAIYNGSYCGPSFGIGDLIIGSFSSCSCSKTSYEFPIRDSEAEFSIQDCEIFQIL